MRKNTLFISAILVLTLTACNSPKSESPTKTVGVGTTIKGDSTQYGLACDGCTDSVLVFLPGKGGDPVSYDIIEAHRNQRVIGRPRTGDWVCLIVNGQNKKKADLVIDLDELKGTWVNMEKPQRRKRMNIKGLPQPSKEAKAKMDSLMKQQMKPVEMGFALKRHYMAQPIGMQYSRNVNEDNDVIYPTPKFYTEWHIFNGRLVLTEGALNMGQKRKVKTRYDSDTVDIVMMMKDSLRLRFKDGKTKGYYRK